MRFTLAALSLLALCHVTSCSSQSKEEASKTGTTATAAPAKSSTETDSSATPAAEPVASKSGFNTGDSTLDSMSYSPKGAILPGKRIFAYYGNPHSKKMGALGEYPKEEMLERLDKEISNWQKADPATPIQPALHLVAISAQGAPGKDGGYRLRMSDKTIKKVIKWGDEHKAIVFLDIQRGHAPLGGEMAYLEKYLKLPFVHLGIDPEFSMVTGHKPGTKIGSYDAADINQAVEFLSKVVKENNIPPKVLVVHRFTQGMIKNYKNIKLNPNVQIVMDMDGWGPPVLKKDSYHDYIQKEPVQYTGFKLFYKNDFRKPGSRIMTPEEVLGLTPKPMYIQYQ
ncbi:lipoprotein [Spirosoma daeguense]